MNSELKILKMMDGRDVICEVKRTTSDNCLIVLNPMILGMVNVKGAETYTAIPYIQGADEAASIYIYGHAISAMASPTSFYTMFYGSALYQQETKKIIAEANGELNNFHKCILQDIKAKIIKKYGVLGDALNAEDLPGDIEKVIH